MLQIEDNQIQDKHIQDKQIQYKLIQDKQIHDDLELLRGREHEMRQIEIELQNMNTIYNELNTIIHEQREAIDSIEANVENASMQVYEGTVMLNRAKCKQSSFRKKLLFLGLFLFVFFVLIVAILIQF